MAVLQVNEGGDGIGKWLGPLSMLATVVPGMQWAAPLLKGASAVNSGLNGDWLGAGVNAFGAGKSLGRGFGDMSPSPESTQAWNQGASMLQTPMETPQMLDTNSMWSQGNPTMSSNAFGGGFSSGVPTPNPLQTNGITEGLSGANTPGLVKDQAFFDDKYKDLSQMYDTQYGTGFKADLARDYYKKHGAGGEFDTEDDQGIFNALMRMYGK